MATWAAMNSAAIDPEERPDVGGDRRGLAERGQGVGAAGDGDGQQQQAELRPAPGLRERAHPPGWWSGRRARGGGRRGGRRRRWSWWWSWWSWWAASWRARARRSAPGGDQVAVAAAAGAELLRRPRSPPGRPGQIVRAMAVVPARARVDPQHPAGLALVDRDAVALEGRSRCPAPTSDAAITTPITASRATTNTATRQVKRLESRPSIRRTGCRSPPRSRRRRRAASSCGRRTPARRVGVDGAASAASPQRPPLRFGLARLQAGLLGLQISAAAAERPPSSTTSTMTTVMLSRPPASLARRTSSSAASVGSASRRSTAAI
jgi:hypothetical protein